MISDIISDILFNLDPMNTCCKENSTFDEYDRIACQIEDLELTTENVSEVFFNSFNVMLDEDLVKEIIKEIIKQIQELK